MTELRNDPSPVQPGAPVTITLGAAKLRGTVRAVGELMPMPMQGSLAESNFRQVVVDLDGASLPVELWLSDEDFDR
ncbi:hypothetical protein OFEAOIEE_LOCUS1115 [Methylorubrum extorquens]